MRTTALWAAHVMQRGVLRLSYALHSLRGYSADERVVIGAEEVAAILHGLARSIDGSVSVCLRRPAYYRFTYDHEGSPRRPVRWLQGPWLLGKLIRQHRKFIYLAEQGFLLPVDGRRFEFEFLVGRDAQVVCVFTGSEIRSHQLLNEFGERRGRDVVTTYQGLVEPGIGGPDREARRRRLARVADDHAMAIVNPPVDQMSWFRRPTLPFPYFALDENIAERPEKWNRPERLVVVHAPTSPIIKGTPLVRAAVTGMREEGFDFEYVELNGVSHEEVTEALRRAHVVLNQFYSFVPGMLGMEAMAANAVVLTSADPRVEPSLPEDAARAWVVTPAWAVMDELRRVLSAETSTLQQQADRGTAWVREHASLSRQGAWLTSLFDDA